MTLYEKIITREEKIAVVGLGYVGMPLAIEFAKKAEVIGFDLNRNKIEEYKNGIDTTKEVGDEEIRSTTVEFTSEEDKLLEAKFYLVAVPTPVTADKIPDLDPIVSASAIIGKKLRRGAIVVYESTVYPGVTEDICIPILEKESGMKCGLDFKIGYSPERINPGDKTHKLKNIVKIVSGIDKESLDEIANVYGLIIEAGVHKASSIRVAEAAKVVENSQRDINIAFMNELAMVFDRMGIDTREVIEAMNTKWNALQFYPGLVGGHCIGVDPYYFVYEAERLGYHSQIVLSGRKINDSMANFIVQTTIKKLILANKIVKKVRVAVLGITFKENCPDIRNSKVIDVIEGLKSYGLEILVVDPQADSMMAREEYGIELVDLEQVADVDCVIFAVAHDAFRNIPMETLDALFKDCPNEEKLIIDIKSILDKRQIHKKGYALWRL